MKKIFLCACTLAVAACARTPSRSKTHDHSENSNANELATYSGKLAFVPEYEPGQNVIVSSELFSLQGYSLLSSIVNAGVRTIYMAPTYRQSQAPADPMTAVRAQAERDLSSPGIEINVSALDAIFSHVMLVPRLEPLYSRNGDEIYPTVWARNWAPLSARSPEERLRIMDLNYYPQRYWDDVFPESLLAILAPTRPELQRVSLPI